MSKRHRMANTDDEAANEARPRTHSERLPGFTHIMMRHPRTEHSRNFPVRLVEDAGNGAGRYEDEQGKTLEVLELHTDSRRSQSALFEVERDDAGVARRQTLVTVVIG